MRDLCETPNYSSGLLNVLTPVLPECNAWPGWSAVMWFVMTAALVAVAFGIRSARRPDWRATP